MTPSIESDFRLVLTWAVAVGAHVAVHTHGRLDVRTPHGAMPATVRAALQRSGEALGMRLRLVAAPVPTVALVALWWEYTAAHFHADERECLTRAIARRRAAQAPLRPLQLLAFADVALRGHHQAGSQHFDPILLST